MRLRATRAASLTAGAGIYIPPGGGGGEFDPATLANTSVYEPWDLSSMFQDAAMTVPVTAAGQSVRVIRDRGSFSRHLIAASDEARPVLATDGGGRYYLDFPSATQVIDSAVTVTTGQPILLAGLLSIPAGSSAGSAPAMQLRQETTAYVHLSFRASIRAARAAVRNVPKGVAVVALKAAVLDWLDAKKSL
jgi:hypothetical protein